MDKMQFVLPNVKAIHSELRIDVDSNCLTVYLNGLDILSIEPENGHIWLFRYCDKEERQKMKELGITLDAKGYPIVKYL
jgi:hypothetical protein